jgi:hypothetical protein
MVRFEESVHSYLYSFWVETSLILAITLNYNINKLNPCMVIRGSKFHTRPILI